jgi:hypothetical protein
VWTPKTKGFTTPTAELRAATYLQCAIRDGFTAIAGRVRYSIAGGTVSRVRIAVDASLTVRRVGCANLAGWDRDASGVLNIALSKPAARDLVVEVWAERKTPRLRAESVPRFEPLGVLRDTGSITLESLADLKLELTKTQGLLRGTSAWSGEWFWKRPACAPGPGPTSTCSRRRRLRGSFSTSKPNAGPASSSCWSACPKTTRSPA